MACSRKTCSIMYAPKIQMHLNIFFIQYCVSCYCLYQVSSKATSTYVFIIQNVHLRLVHLWTTDEKGILPRPSFVFAEEWARKTVLGHNEAKRLLLVLFGQKPESAYFAFSLCICILYYRTAYLQVSQSCWTMIAVKWQMKTLFKGFTILSVVACPNTWNTSILVDLPLKMTNQQQYCCSLSKDN